MAAKAAGLKPVLMSEGETTGSIPQFGEKRAGLTYHERQCAYGLAADETGRLAVARIEKTLFFHQFDLPGGALDGGETEPEAMAREFREETGLEVEALEKLGTAGQYWRKRSLGPTNNICHFYIARLVGRAGEPVDPDHTLVWLDPEEAARKVRHGAHSWAIQRWMGVSVPPS